VYPFHRDRQPRQHHQDGKVERDEIEHRIGRDRVFEPGVRQVAQAQPEERDDEDAERVAPPVVPSQVDEVEIARGPGLHRHNRHMALPGRR
jgi:hypothetical protein